MNDEELEESILELEDFIHKNNALSAQVLTEIYAYFGQPVMENDLMTKAQEALFHSIPGRGVLFSMNQFNTNLNMAMTWLMANTISEVLKYFIQISGAGTGGIVIQFAVVFALFIFVSVYTSVQRKMIIDRLGGDENIFETTDADREFYDDLKRRVRKGR